MKIEIDVLTYNILLVMIMSLCAYFISPWCFLMVFCGARKEQEKWILDKPTPPIYLKQYWTELEANTSPQKMPNW